MKKVLARWAVLAIAAPVAAWALGKVADKVEDSRGPNSKIVKSLRFGRGTLRSV